MGWRGGRHQLKPATLAVRAVSGDCRKPGGSLTLNHLGTAGKQKGTSPRTIFFRLVRRCGRRNGGAITVHALNKMPPVVASVQGDGHRLVGHGVGTHVMTAVGHPPHRARALSQRPARDDCQTAQDDLPEM